jgi:hypothetical protein
VHPSGPARETCPLPARPASDAVATGVGPHRSGSMLLERPFDEGPLTSIWPANLPERAAPRSFRTAIGGRFSHRIAWPRLCTEGRSGDTRRVS